MKNNVKNLENGKTSSNRKDILLLEKEIISLNKKRRWERIFWIIITWVLIFFLLKNCKGRRDCESDFDNYMMIHNEMTEDLMDRIYELENRKAVLEITDIKGSADKEVVAIIVPLEDPRPSSVIVKAKRVPYPVKVEVPDSSAIIMLQDCAKANEGLIALLLEKDNLLNNLNKEEITEKCLTMSLVKTSFYKKDTVQKTIADYSSPVTFSSITGFKEDNFAFNYLYLNENKDSSIFSLNSLLLGNTLTLGINQNGKSLLSEKKVFPLGNASLRLMKDFQSISFDWTSQMFYETTFNKKKFNKSIVEIVGGATGIAGGIVGSWYYTTHPIVEVNVYQGDKLVGTDKTFNTPMQIVSAVAIPVGTYFLIKGIRDRRFSFVITPVEFSFKYNLGNE